ALPGPEPHHPRRRAGGDPGAHGLRQVHPAAPWRRPLHAELRDRHARRHRYPADRSRRTARGRGPAAAGRAALPRHAAREPRHGARRPRGGRRQADRCAAQLRPGALRGPASARARHVHRRGWPGPLGRPEAAGHAGPPRAARSGHRAPRRAEQRPRSQHREAGPAVPRALGLQRRAAAHPRHRHPPAADHGDRRSRHRHGGGQHHPRCAARPGDAGAAARYHDPRRQGRGRMSTATFEYGESPRLAFLAVALMLLTLGGFILWASWAELEEVTRGQGRVVPSSKEQVIQSLDPGILTELLVREGDVVEKGQLLLRIDPTRAEAMYRELEAKAVALAATAARLRAEAYGGKLEFPDKVRAHPEVLRRETDVYKSRVRALEESLAGLNRGIALLDREISITEPMVGRGLVSEVELLRLK